MRDIVFIAVVVGFFALAVLFVKACESILEQERRLVGWQNAVGLVLSIAVLAYLVYALLAPEKLG